jgi:branched-chain amino acid transport system substrate-binding protein
MVTEAFYRDLDDETRTFTDRFGGRVPTANQAGVYSSIRACLHTVQAGPIDGKPVIAAVRRHPIRGNLFGTVTVCQDGRALHDMYIFAVEAPAKSRSRWDAYSVFAQILGNDAFRPIDQGGRGLDDTIERDGMNSAISLCFLFDRVIRTFGESAFGHHALG